MVNEPDEEESSGAKVSPEGATRPAERALKVAENGVYIMAAVLLVAAAVVVLLATGYHLATDAPDGVEEAITAALDGLLLVFIVLELLAVIRSTIMERQLVAEPFLIVGIIASIKEIIVITLRARQEGGDSGKFAEAMIEVGTLGGLILLLAIASYLIRRKEREPEEDE